MLRRTALAILVLSFVSSLLFTVATAKIEIVYPDSDHYAVANRSLNVLWKHTEDDPPRFQMYLKHPEMVTLQDFGLANNVDTTSDNRTVQITNIPARNGYLIFFTKLDDIKTVYATSQPFEIKPNGTQPSNYTGSEESGGNGTDDANTKNGSSNAFWPAKDTSIAAAFIVTMFVTLVA